MSTEATETQRLTPLEVTRLTGLAALIFVILASYAIARPATESLFLEANGATSLPKAWLMVGLGSLGVVTLYNRWSATTDLVRIFGVASTISGLILVGILLGMELKLPGMTWWLYLWKDLYIVVLIEVFWSFANSTVPKDRAKWWYGLFCVLGSMGGMAGNLGVGWLATATSTEQSLWAVVPLLAIGGGGGIALARFAGVNAESPTTRSTSLRDGFRVLQSSRSLWLLMGLIAMTQVVITLVDYQFSIAIEQFYPDKDTRTAAIGQVYAAIDLAALSLQLTTGPILRLLGVPLVLLTIPGLLGAAVAGYALVPQYAAIAAAKVASKAMDYSLFRAAKEIMYIPLTHAERTQGKAFVDMMSYRMAKGATSLMLLGLIGFGRPELALWLTLGCVGLWVWITVRLNRSQHPTA
jgi:AAA family ATP:ADP antiporter